MRTSKIETDGRARDEAVKRRNKAMRETLGMSPVPSQEAARPTEPLPAEKPTESSAT
jgi:hypothetical protein